MNIIETVARHGNIRLTALEQKMLKDANLKLVENTIMTEKAGPHQITTALVVASEDNIFALRPEVHAVSQPIVRLGDILNINCEAYILLYIRNQRGSGVHLLPIKDLVPLHQISGQACAGTLRDNLPVYRSPALRLLSQQIFETYVLAPECGGITIPPEHVSTHEQLERQYEETRADLRARLSQSNQLYSVAKNLWVSIPSAEDAARTIICPSSYLDMAIIPTQLDPPAPWRVRIVMSELALTDGVLTGNPCHAGAAHAIVEAKISASTMYHVLTRCAWIASNWLSSFDCGEKFEMMEE